MSVISSTVTFHTGSTFFLASCSSASAVSFGLVCCFSGTDRLLLHSSVRMGRVPPDCVLAFGLHKPQLPNKHYRHGDGGRGVEQSCMLAVEKMFSTFLLMTMDIHHYNRNFTDVYNRKVLTFWSPESFIGSLSLCFIRLNEFDFPAYGSFVYRLQVASCPGDSR